MSKNEPQQRLTPCPDTPNCVSSQATATIHAIEPLPFSGSVEETRERLLAILRARPRTRITRVDGNAIHAEVRTRVFRFVDDLELLLDAEARVVHVRSASRVGYSDLGVNRRRVETLRRDLARPTQG